MQVALTHYTANPENVVSILENGFVWAAKRRHLIRDFLPEHDYKKPKREPQQFGLISFTALPPEHAAAVRNRFGRFGIAVTAEWAVERNIGQVVYMPPVGPVFDVLKSLFELGYKEMKDSVQHPEDGMWTMGFENASAAASINGAMLWANLLRLYEFLEPAHYAEQCEWRFVNSTPMYSIKEKPKASVADVVPAKNWALVDGLLAVKIRPPGIAYLVTPIGKASELRDRLPSDFADVHIKET